MKVFLTAGVAIILAGCVQSQSPHTSHQQTTIKPVAQLADNPWQVGETKSYETAIGVTSVVRKGKTPSGSTYSFYLPTAPRVGHFPAKLTKSMIRRSAK
jgi:hypothetical protein